MNLPFVPQSPHLAYRMEIDGGSRRYQVVPVGSSWVQILIYVLLGSIPILTGVGGVLIYVQSFYKVKFNKFGTSQKVAFFPKLFRRKFQRLNGDEPIDDQSAIEKGARSASPMPSPALGSTSVINAASHRRVVLIATMEYDIEDWSIKIKIGGLGVMAQLMGKNLGHQDLIWIVPCVGGVDYPENPDEHAQPMTVTVMGEIYEIQVRTHVLRNITYVLLDAPVFRQQSKSEPYPPRMDDLDSAIYYSAWNACIAEAIRRYKPDLYHINDYHGAAAPLYLLPDTIPCALSLHNAEFQGLWPMRSKQESEEVCKVYNLDPEIVQDYVQFGEVFNLLHAGASYLRLHQDGFGAVGVSKKYGKRSYARYPIFWGLKDIGALPNPDPSDTAEWNPNEEEQSVSKIPVDKKLEAGRAQLRMDAQKWAGLKVDPSAELFVFVGRWSMQKGIDLIADIFPSILEKHPKTQLICVGPVIDLYGKFAAIKLAKMMEVYPGRVYSKPEFTALPPYIFSGAEFALIPSRDEPFGLVAVEFGRKGALGVGARVGGLGQMPGWWFTVESTSTKHMLHQFKGAIEGALSSSKKTRAELRARSAKQRFPVAQWVRDLETLQSMAIEKHRKYGQKSRRKSFVSMDRGRSPDRTSRMISRPVSRASFGGRNDNAVPLIDLDSQGRQRSPSIISDSGRSLSPLIDPGTHGRQRSPSLVSGRRRSLSPAPLFDGDRQARNRRGSESSSRVSSPSPGPPFKNNLGVIQRMGSRKGPGHEPKFRQARPSIKPSPAIPEDDYEDDSVSSEDDEMDEYLGQRDPGVSTTDLINAQHPRPISIYGTPNRPAELPSLSLEPTASAWDYDMPAMQDVPSIPRLHEIPPTPMSPSGHHHIDTSYRGAAELIPPPLSLYIQPTNASTLSVDAVVGTHSEFALQNVNPSFTDSKQDYQHVFERKLESLSAKNSYDTCIEEFIEKSQKDWFNRLREVKLGKTRSRSNSVFGGSEHGSGHGSANDANYDDVISDGDSTKEFLLGDYYEPPKGVKKFMLRRVGDWPVYSLLLAFVRRPANYEKIS